MAKSGYKVRLYPSPGQKIALARTFGNVRFIFNQYVNFRQFEYEHGYNDKETRFTFSELRSLLTSQNKDEFPWLSDSSSSALQEACQQADDAYWLTSSPPSRTEIPDSSTTASGRSQRLLRRSYTVSTGVHGKPCRVDVSGRVHVAVMLRTAVALPVPDRERLAVGHGAAL